jgi:hypothetical protein
MSMLPLKSPKSKAAIEAREPGRANIKPGTIGPAESCTVLCHGPRHFCYLAYMCLLRLAMTIRLWYRLFTVRHSSSSPNQAAFKQAEFQLLVYQEALNIGCAHGPQTRSCA